MYRFSFFLIYVPFCLFFPCLCGVRSFRRLSNELGPSFTPVFNLIGQDEAMSKTAEERPYVERQNSLKTNWEKATFLNTCWGATWPNLELEFST